MRRIVGLLSLTLLLSACDPAATPALPGATPTRTPPDTAASPAPVPSASQTAPPAATVTPAPTPTPQPAATPTAVPSRVIGATIEGYVYKYVDPAFPPPSSSKTPLTGAIVSAFSKTPEKPYNQTVQNASPNYVLTGVPLDADIDITAQLGDFSGTVHLHTGTVIDRKFVAIEIKRSF